MEIQFGWLRISSKRENLHSMNQSKIYSVCISYSKLGLKNLSANRKSKSITLKEPWGGTGHVVYNNSLYYNRWANIEKPHCNQIKVQYLDHGQIQFGNWRIPTWNSSKWTLWQSRRLSTFCIHRLWLCYRRRGSMGRGLNLQGFHALRIKFNLFERLFIRRWRIRLIW